MVRRMEEIVEHLIIFIALLLIPVVIFICIAAAIKRSKKLAKLALVLAVVSLAAIVRGNYSEFWHVGGCLDMGGGYNYERQECEF